MLLEEHPLIIEAFPLLRALILKRRSCWKELIMSAGIKLRLGMSPSLEAELAGSSDQGVLLLHPHPLYGGSMDNPVIHELFQALQPSFCVLRFNFRGVGLSQGSYSGGQGELQDALTALEFLSQRCSMIHLVGYSFGAWIATQAGWNHPKLQKLVLISPPVELMDFSLLLKCSKPKLLITGSRDGIASPASVQKFADGIPQPKSIAIIPGADHFWSFGLGSLIECVRRYLCECAE